MEKVVLKSMTDFVLEQESKCPYIYPVINYAKFLKQPLTLGMFVPCDKKGNVYVDYKNYQPKKGTICIPYEGLFEVSKKGKDVEFLNEPQFWKDDQRYYNKRKYEEALKEYQEAKNRVLFEGFQINKLNRHRLNKTVSLESIFHVFWFCSVSNKWNLSQGISSIEDLVKYNLVLTESAKQKIFNT